MMLARYALDHVLANELDAAVFAVGLELAKENTIDAGDDDVVVALRQSVTAAAVIADLCRVLNVSLPWCVHQALHDGSNDDHMLD